MRVKKTNYTEYLCVIAVIIISLICCNSSPKDAEDDYAAITPTVPDGGAYDQDACWSSVHNLIAYVHNQQTEQDDPDSTGIYLVNPDGIGRRLFFRFNSIFSGMDWSSDGESFVIKVGSDLLKLSYPDKKLDTLLMGVQNHLPSFSPDGNSIATCINIAEIGGIFAINSDGSNYHRILGGVTFPCWAYSDSIICLDMDYPLPISAISMADTSGTFQRLIYDPAGKFIPGSVRPSFHSVTGRMLLLAQVPGEQESIWRMESINSTPEFLVTGIFPEFSPDGNQVVFTRRGRHYANLWVINWDGTGLRQLTEPLNPIPE